MPENLTCPVCKGAVSSSSSMCHSCHLPIREVREHQPRSRRAPRTRAAGRWAAIRLVGLFVYVGLVAVCASLEPKAQALVMVLPAALVGMVLHVVRGRLWIGLASAILVAGLVGTVAHVFEVPPFDDSPVAQGPQENDEITYKNLTVANVGGYYGGRSSSEITRTSTLTRTSGFTSTTGTRTWESSPESSA